jgi:hypothetical protein
VGELANAVMTMGTSDFQRLRRFIVRGSISRLPATTSTAFIELFLLFVPWVIRRLHHAHHPAGLIRIGVVILLHYRHGNAPPLLAVSSNICFRQREVDVAVACGTMPHIVRFRRLQLAPLLRTDEFESAPDSPFFIPRHVVLWRPAHCSKNEDARPVGNRPF